MMCYRGMTFCSDAPNCKNRDGCYRYLRPELKEDAKKWWGGDGAPIAWANFSTDCPKWEAE